MSRLQLIGKIILQMMIGILFIAAVSLYLFYWKCIPAQIQILSGSTQHFFWQVPAKGVLYEEEGRNRVTEVFLEHPIALTASGAKASYLVDLKLYGFIPFKQMSIDVVDEKKVCPVGEAYGFYLETQGVLVVGTGQFLSADGRSVNPVQSLIESGDTILSLNGQEVKKKRELIQCVRNCGGEQIDICVKRGEQKKHLMVRPEKAKDGEYKLGIWVRDNAQGVGTITYVDENGNFGALGHPIVDTDTNQILSIEHGKLYQTEIVEIKKGMEYDVGELLGIIDYRKQYLQGELFENKENGIFGYSRALRQKMTEEQFVQIGMKQEIHKGKAYIESSISGETKLYEIEILSYQLDDETNKAITFQVVDEELLSLTGGIIQGMSGTPIIQDGKLIGAVTHVFVHDPKKGFGIFIENMIGQQ